MDCPVCIEPFEIKDMYTVNCMSSVPHRMCHPCETNLRLTMSVKDGERALKCPNCRTVEKTPGNRNESSFQAELKYVSLQPFNFSHYYVQQILRDRLVEQNRRYIERLTRVPLWCQSGLREVNQCRTKGKTVRKCSYPAGCTRNVCRSCKMCVFHFEF